jgi:hypothetical protein
MLSLRSLAFILCSAIRRARAPCPALHSIPFPTELTEGKWLQIWPLPCAVSCDAPTGCFATAVFLVLNRISGELTFVNAGQNAPMVFGLESTTPLEATGMPLGLFADTKYETGSAVIHYGETVLLFTDGLTDSISGSNPERLLREALAVRSGTTMSNLKSLINPEFNEDDVTILLLRRNAAGDSSSKPPCEPSS